MKLYGNISDPRDVVNKKYVDEAVAAISENAELISALVAALSTNPEFITKILEALPTAEGVEF